MAAVYHARITQHGYTAHTLIYSDPSLHRDKLIQYSTLLSLHVPPGATLLDVGCGFGALVPYLPPVSYTGIDIVPEFINEARRRYPSQDFRLTDLSALPTTETYSWVVVLGVTGSVPDPAAIVSQAWEHAINGLMVDFIDHTLYSGKLHSFDIGDCTRAFLAMGARTLTVDATSPHAWRILIAQR